MWTVLSLLALKRRTRRAAARSFSPRVEALEDRHCPSPAVFEWSDPTGFPDPTFNPAGSTPGSEIYAPGGYIAHAVAVYPATDTTGNANKIVAVGNQVYHLSNGQTAYRMSVARFNSDGSPDTTFSSIGEVSLDFSKSTGFADADAVAIQPDGKIVVAGFNTTNTSRNFAVARLNLNGSYDTTFNKTGMVQTNVGNGSYDAANGIALQPDGKIVLAGRTTSSSGLYASAVVRYTSTGSLDKTWGGTGVRVLLLGANNSWFTSVGMQGGQVVAVGTAVVLGAPVGSFDLVRFTSTGTLDSTFGTGGVVITPAQGTAGDTANALAVQPDGRLVVGGDVATPAPDGSGAFYSSFALARYTPNGSLDPTFNGTGRVTIQNAASQDNAFTAVLYHPANGRIVAAGYASEQGFAVAQFNPDGSRDGTFGVNGMTITTFGDLSLGAPEGAAAALQSDGRIVLAGGARQTSAPGGWSWALARYLTSAPQIGTFTASSYAPPADGSVTLTASNITDGNPGAAVTQLAFFIMIDGAPQFLGYGTQNSDGSWSYAFDTTGYAPGTYTLYAQATDNYGTVGDPVALTLTIQ
jgi:uncharacterized delta-60 repeat protein